MAQNHTNKSDGEIFPSGCKMAILDHQHGTNMNLILHSRNEMYKTSSLTSDGEHEGGSLIFIHCKQVHRVVIISYSVIAEMEYQFQCGGSLTKFLQHLQLQTKLENTLPGQERLLVPPTWNSYHC